MRPTSFWAAFAIFTTTPRAHGAEVLIGFLSLVAVPLVWQVVEHGSSSVGYEGYKGLREAAAPRGPEWERVTP